MAESPFPEAERVGLFRQDRETLSTSASTHCPFLRRVAKPYSEEPDSGNPLVQICGGWILSLSS